MSRPRRYSPGGMVFHVLNRGAGRRVLFTKDEDFLAFEYFYQVVRYVERKALRANLVEQAESWRWSSLRRVEREDTAFPILSAWPLPRPTDWLQLVNQPQTEAEVSGGVAVLRQSRSALRRSQLGHKHGRAIGAEWTIRPRGRPKKQS